MTKMSTEEAFVKVLQMHGIENVVLSRPVNDKLRCLLYWDNQLDFLE